MTTKATARQWGNLVATAWTLVGLSACMHRIPLPRLLGSTTESTATTTDGPKCAARPNGVLFSDDRTHILILEFGRGSGRNLEFGNQVTQDLSRAAKQFLQLEARSELARQYGVSGRIAEIATLPCSAQTDLEAAEIGQIWDADLVIWGSARARLESDSPTIIVENAQVGAGARNIVIGGHQVVAGDDADVTMAPTMRAPFQLEAFVTVPGALAEEGFSLGDRSGPVGFQDNMALADLDLPSLGGAELAIAMDLAVANGLATKHELAGFRAYLSRALGRATEYGPGTELHFDLEFAALGIDALLGAPERPESIVERLDNACGEDADCVCNGYVLATRSAGLLKEEEAVETWWKSAADHAEHRDLPMCRVRAAAAFAFASSDGPLAVERARLALTTAEANGSRRFRIEAAILLLVAGVRLKDEVACKQGSIALEQAMSPESTGLQRGIWLAFRAEAAHILGELREARELEQEAFESLGEAKATEASALWNQIVLLHLMGGRKREAHIDAKRATRFFARANEEELERIMQFSVIATGSSSARLMANKISRFRARMEGKESAALLVSLAQVELLLGSARFDLEMVRNGTIDMTVGSARAGMFGPRLDKLLEEVVEVSWGSEAATMTLLEIAERLEPGRAPRDRILEFLCAGISGGTTDAAVLEAWAHTPGNEQFECDATNTE